MSVTADSPIAEFAGHTSEFKYIPIADMEVCPPAQRVYDPAWAHKLAVEWNPMGLGHPVLSIRGGIPYIVNGQHRIAAKKIREEGHEKILCECFTGLTEEEEAELFLVRNNDKLVSVFEKFRVGLTAGRSTETEIYDTVTDAGCRIVISTAPGSIRAVGTLRQIHKRGGARLLGQTLRVIHNAFGDHAFHALVMNGISLVLQRYADQVNEAHATMRLMSVRGGVNALINRAEQTHKQTNNSKSHCFAAAVVEVLNTYEDDSGVTKPLPGNDSRRLASWWRKR